MAPPTSSTSPTMATSHDASIPARRLGFHGSVPKNAAQIWPRRSVTTLWIDGLGACGSRSVIIATAPSRGGGSRCAVKSHQSTRRQTDKHYRTNGQRCRDVRRRRRGDNPHRGESGWQTSRRAQAGIKQKLELDRALKAKIHHSEPLFSFLCFRSSFNDTTRQFARRRPSRRRVPDELGG